MSPGRADGSDDVRGFTGFSLGASDPQTMGPFRLRARLGQGGMGVVYLAVGVRQETVALKVIHPAHADQPEFRARFAREVRAMQSVHGPFTAEVVAANVVGTPHWVAMEYVPGRTLADAVHSSGPLDTRQVQLLALGLAEALVAIHAAGVVHRDLKPSNVILAADGPRVIDFGIADLSDATSITGTDARIGSMAWMAPEQLRGAKVATAGDVHAWAQLVYFAATGTGAFGAGTPTAIGLSIMAQIMNLDALPPALAKMRPLLASSLSQEPAARPTAAALVDQIGALLDPLMLASSFTTDATRLIHQEWCPPHVPTVRLPPPRVVVPAPVSTSSVLPNPRESSRRRKAGIWAAAALLAGGFAGGLAMFGLRHDTAADPVPANPSADATTASNSGATPVNFPVGNSLWQVTNYPDEPDDSVVLATRYADVVCYQYLGPGDGETFYGRSEVSDSEVRVTGAIVANFSRPAKFAVGGTGQHLQLSELHPSGSRGTPSDWRSISEQEAINMGPRTPSEVAKQLNQQLESLAFECSQPEPATSLS